MPIRTPRGPRHGSPLVDLTNIGEVTVETEAPTDAVGALTKAFLALVGDKAPDKGRSPFDRVPDDPRYVPLSKPGSHPWPLTAAMIGPDWPGGIGFVDLSAGGHIHAHLPGLAAKPGGAAFREMSFLVPALARLADCVVELRSGGAVSVPRTLATLEATVIFLETRFDGLLASQAAAGQPDGSEAAIIARSSLAALDKDLALAGRRSKLGAGVTRLIDAAISRQVLQKVLPSAAPPAAAPAAAPGKRPPGNPRPRKDRANRPPAPSPANPKNPSSSHDAARGTQ